MFQQSRFKTALALAVLLVSLSIAAVDSSVVPTAQNMVAADDLEPTPLGPWYQGTASFFGGPQATAADTFKVTIDSGSCGYGDLDPKLWPFYNVVGLNPNNELIKTRPQGACGSCLEIECTGPRCNKNVTTLPVVITDSCNWDCNATNINMYVFAFEQLAPLKYGRTTIRYRLVTCTPADPIIVHIQDYRATLGGWIRLAFKNVAGDAGLTAVELAAAGSDFRAQARVLNASSPWLSMDNTFGAVWEASNLPEPPLDIRITNSVGEKVVIKNAIAVPGIVGDIETTPQFPVTNYKITHGINPNATLGLNGTRGNRTARIRNPRTNRTALAVRPEAAATRKQAGTAYSEKAGHLVGVGLALPQVPQKEFAVRRYSQQLERAGKPVTAASSTTVVPTRAAIPATRVTAAGAAVHKATPAVTAVGTATRTAATAAGAAAHKATTAAGTVARTATTAAGSVARTATTAAGTAAHKATTAAATTVRKASTAVTAVRTAVQRATRATTAKAAPSAAATSGSLGARRMLGM